MFEGATLKYRDSIISHMNFLWYNYENAINNQAAIFDVFTHPIKRNFWIEYKNDFMMLTAALNVGDLKIDISKINELNEMKAVKVSYSKVANTLTFLFHINYYEQTNFTNILDFFHGSIDMCIEELNQWKKFRFSLFS